MNEIDKLKSEKQKLESDLGIYINENKKLENLKNELSNKLKILESNNYRNNLNDQMITDKDKKMPMMEELKTKDSHTNELNISKDLIPVIFQSMDQKIIYAIICRKTDKFNNIENILYENFPELEETEEYENSFKVKGRRIKKSRTMAQNNINYSDIIVVNKVKIE